MLFGVAEKCFEIAIRSSIVLKGQHLSVCHIGAMLFIVSLNYMALNSHWHKLYGCSDFMLLMTSIVTLAMY